MTDNVCDSWEDVDVDKIVIKPACKVKDKKTNLVGPLQTQTNLSFNIEESGSNIIVNNNTVPTQSNANAFKILQRVPQASVAPVFSSPALLPTPSLPSNRLSTISYSSVASSQLSPNATPFEYQPKVVLEDNTRTQFVAPLRILRNPNSKPDQAKDSRSNVDVNKQLLKSFEEKQAEYAKARLRILGEKMPVENLNLNDITETVEQLSVSQTEKISPTSTKSSNNSSPSKPVNNICNNNNVIIIREPTVPDGTKGFRYVR